jgi:hypothetical protein
MEKLKFTSLKAFAWSAMNHKTPLRNQGKASVQTPERPWSTLETLRPYSQPTNYAFGSTCVIRNAILITFSSLVVQIVQSEGYAHRLSRIATRGHDAMECTATHREISRRT